jgi:hypothetical protein
MTSTYWFCAVVTALSSFISLGFSIAALASGGDQVNARYAFSRSLALAIASAIPLLRPSQTWVEAVASAMVAVQVADAVVGGSQRDAMKALGPAILAMINLVALVLLIR